MPDTNPDENLDAEGIPDLEERSPGHDVELEEEGMMAPRDYSVAAGSDPAYATTSAEERVHESVADRARRENPEVGTGDFGREDEDSVAGALYEPDSDVDEVDVTAEETAEMGDEAGAFSAEEAAMHITSEDVADDIDPGVERREYTEDR